MNDYREVPPEIGRQLLAIMACTTYDETQRAIQQLAHRGFGVYERNAVAPEGGQGHTHFLHTLLADEGSRRVATVNALARRQGGVESANFVLQAAYCDSPQATHSAGVAVLNSLFALFKFDFEWDGGEDFANWMQDGAHDARVAQFAIVVPETGLSMSVELFVYRQPTCEYRVVLDWKLAAPRRT